MSYSISDLSNEIRLKCLDAGFCKAGFSKAESLGNEALHLQQWLEEKRNAEMEWMSRTLEKRTNPGFVMENVKSIISLAYLYDTPFEHSQDPDKPKISRYAWGQRDYHKILKKKLKLLCSEIESLKNGVETKFYVDDGPVMDKAWAVRSGIGWLGKNTNVIDKTTGSFFFLSTILINEELKYDSPVEDLCKSCTLCISSCPTGAIYDEYKLDSNLCLSYQTIENRGDIPENIKLSGWIFGCDVCQDVCPFNHNRIFTNDTNFYPREEIVNKSYDELLSINEEEFDHMFSGTPVKRTKYTGWKRNLLKAMNEQRKI